MRHGPVRRTTAVASVALLALSVVARADTDLSGTWRIGERPRRALLVQQGGQVELRFGDEPTSWFRGSLRGTRLELRRPFAEREMARVPRDEGLAVWQAVARHGVRIEGTLLPDGRTIEATMITPTWRTEPVELQAEEDFRRSDVTLHHVGSCPERLRDAVVADRERDYRCVSGFAPPPAWRRERATLPERLEATVRAMLDVDGDVSFIGSACDQIPPRHEDLADAVNLGIVAEYYWSRERLTEAVMATLETIAALEALGAMECDDVSRLGASVVRRHLAGVDCTALKDVPGGAEACEAVRSSCSGRSVSFREVVASTAQARHTLHLLEQRARKLECDIQPDCGRAWVGIEALEALQRDLERTRSGMATVRSAVPWLDMDGFQDAVTEALGRHPNAGPAYDPLACAGLRAVATSALALQRQRLESFGKAMTCLDLRVGEESDCQLDVEGLRDALDLAPPFEATAAGRRIRGEVDSWSERWSLMQVDLADCRSEVRTWEGQAEEIERELIIGAGLTVLTVGFGGAALALSRLAVARQSASLARAAHLVSVTGTRVAAVADALDLARSLFQSLSECDRLAELGRREDRVESAAGRCPTGAEGPGAPIAVEYTTCVLRAVAADLALAAVPGVPAGIRAVREADLARRARRALPGASLSRSQLDVITAAFRGRMSREGVRDAIESLRRSGLSDAQIQRLFRDLAPDDIARAARTELRFDRARAALGGRSLTAEQEAALRQALSLDFDATHPHALGRAEQLLRQAGLGDAEAARLLDDVLPGVRRVGDDLVQGLSGRVVAHAPLGEHRLVMTVRDGRARIALCTTCHLDFLDRVERAAGAVPASVRAELAAIRREFDAIAAAAAGGTHDADRVRAAAARLDDFLGRNPTLSGAARSTSTAPSRVARPTARPVYDGDPEEIIDPRTQPNWGRLDEDQRAIQLEAYVQRMRDQAFEEESLEALAQAGYAVVGHPSGTRVSRTVTSGREAGGFRATANPDAVIEGRVFDVYAAREDTSLRGVYSKVQEKVEREQSWRVVVNLTRSQLSPQDLAQELWRHPLPTGRTSGQPLREVIVVKGDEVTRIFPVPDG